MEARQSRERVLVLGFDTQDFDSTRTCGPQSHKWRQLVPRRYGGFQWRYWLRTYKPEQLFSTAVGLIDLLSEEEFVTLSEIFETTCKKVPEQATTAAVLR